MTMVCLRFFIQVKQSNGDNLPDGISFLDDNFVIHGTPAITGEFTILVSVEDQEGYTLSDEFLLTIDDPSGIEEIGSVLLNIYPNPAKNSVFINHEIISTSTGYTLYNTQGKIVKKGYLKSNSIDVSELANGLYFISIISGEKLFTAKFFKE